MSRSALPAESKREVAKAQTRRGLLKSALQLYSREGAQGLSMNKVAKGAGIAQPSFYNHFESLDALQLELSDQLKTHYLSPMRQAWVDMLKDYDSLDHEQFQLRCQQCLSMIFDSAFQNITLFQHLIEDRPRFHNPDKSALEKGKLGKGSLGNLITELQDEWTEIFIQGLQLSGRTFERSDVHLCVDIAAAQVHELILGCHEQRYAREQAIRILSRNFDALFISLFARK
jgi:TetR/AcrR family transcriptional regulator of autoinduction and epiphytic fitness